MVGQGNSSADVKHGSHCGRLYGPWLDASGLAWQSNEGCLYLGRFLLQGGVLQGDAAFLGLSCSGGQGWTGEYTYGGSGPRCFIDP